MQRSLKAAAKALDKAARLLGSASLRRQASTNGTGAKPRKLSPKAAAALKLQGRYLGYVRQLEPKQRLAIRALRERKGVEAAIARARNLARKK